MFNLRFSGDMVKARTRKHLSQQEIAEAIGVSVRQYQRIEKGLCQPKAEVFLRLVLTLDLNIEDYREVVFSYVPISSR